MPKQPVVPQADPGLRVRRYRALIETAIARVLDSGRYVLGSETEAFEAEFAACLGVPHAVGVNSGTDALSLALLALGVEPGDEVLVPALTAPATAVAVRRAGAIPVFVDVDRNTRGLDPQDMAARVGQRTVAVIVVHLHGMPARMDEILSIAGIHKLAVVEDCAQALGAQIRGRRVGSLGDVAAFSFYPTKNLGALGDAGAVVTASAQIADRVRRMRHYGVDAAGFCTDAGMNSRMDEVQAAILRALLPYTETGNHERQTLAAYYDQVFMELAREGRLVLPPTDPGAVYHQYAVEVAERDAVRQALSAQGIDTGVHYAQAVSSHPAFRGLGAAMPEFPVAEHLAQRLLSLPIQPELAVHRERVATGLVRVLARGSR
jgi:dTDP-4-amino-4,6-dideoxygalactose transaminase